MTEFDHEAVEDMADVFGSLQERDVNKPAGLLNEISDVCDAHNITEPERRKDLAIAGASHFFDREKESVLSDLAEILEAQYQMLGYDQ